MKKYIKKPIVIEAYQTDKEIDIETLEGTMHVSTGDYIITGVNGEQYPCKPDIFEKTYDEFNEDEISSNMTFNEYQAKTNETAIYPKENLMGLYYVALGACGETGEIANKIKKILRDSGGVLDEEKAVEIRKELGDVLWYISQLATELRVDLGDVAKQNIDKLFSRKERGVLGGSGDNR